VFAVAAVMFISVSLRVLRGMLPMGTTLVRSARQLRPLPD